MHTPTKARPLFDPPIVRRAIVDALWKLDPRRQIRNPVMFTVLVGAVLTTCLGVQAVFDRGTESASFILAVSAWLWFTVLFANFAEAMAEGRGKAQADSLRRTRTDTQAKLLTGEDHTNYKSVPGTSLKVGDIVLVEAGDIIPSDGEVIEGVASVNEAAITGESAPVIRESGGDRSAVTGGTQVLSDWIRVRITAAAGSTFIDRMIALVEGAERLAQSGGVPYILRSPEEIGSLFAGLELVEPGLVQITKWRPDGEADWLDAYGAVARKPVS